MIKKFKILVLSVLALISSSCSDDTEQRFRTFEQETVASFLENDENFTEFYQVLKASGYVDLLNAYGTYTCFAPTNDAMQKYYSENDKMMHNRGYIKGPESWRNGWDAALTLRGFYRSIRRVVATVTFDTMKPHTFRVKTVQEDNTLSFQMDYFEFMPIQQLENEDRD